MCHANAPPPPTGPRLVGCARQLPRIIVERLGDLGVPDHHLPLVANASGQRSGQHGDGEKNEEREQFLRLCDRERVDRLDEEEIVRRERRQRREDCRAGPKAHRAEQDRGQEDHRQVGKLEDRGERFGDGDRDGDRGERDRKLGPQSPPAEQRLQARPERRSRLFARNDVNLDSAGAAHQRLRQRATKHAAQGPRLRLTEHDLRDIFARRESQNVTRKVVALKAHGLAAQTLGEAEHFGEPVGALGVARLADRLDSHCDPVCVEAGRELARAPDHPLRHVVRANAGEQAFGRGPRTLDRLLAQVVDHLVVDAVGGAAQRQLAQRRQIAGSEETLRRATRRLRHIDLAVVQALDEFVGREIDQNDVGGLLQDEVGDSLAHGDAGDAGHDVGEALEMLDVERRPDADARVEQLLHVLPAFRMPAVRSVGVGELVDDDQLGLARKRRVQIEFIEGAAVIFDLAPRKDFEPFDERARFGAAMRLDEPDDDIDAFIS